MKMCNTTLLHEMDINVKVIILLVQQNLLNPIG